MPISRNLQSTLRSVVMLDDRSPQLFESVLNSQGASANFDMITNWMLKNHFEGNRYATVGVQKGL